MNKLNWNVFTFDINRDAIEVYNIFEHGSFMRDLIKTNKEQADSNAFLEAVWKDLMYYFWSKAEHEVIISGMFSDKSDTKVDVYRQLEINKERFDEYLLAHRDLIPKKARD